MILGHEKQLKYFDRLIKNGRLGHAYLLYGPEHVGKFTVAKYIAEKLGCKNPVIVDLEHTLVSKKEERKEIPIEDIRELKRILSLAPVGGSWRAVIINDAHELSQESANALLKVLEEPGGNTVFFIVAPDRESLPATIVSRAVAVRFSLVGETTLRSYCEKNSKDTKLCDEILSLSFGRPGFLIQYVKDPEAFREAQKFSTGLTLALRGGVPEIFKLSEKISRDNALRPRAGIYLLQYLRSLLRTENARLALAEKIKNVQKIDALAQSTNVNPRLALDVMLLEARLINE